MPCSLRARRRRKSSTTTADQLTDQNASTGILEPFGLGADYGLDFAAASGLVVVNKANPVNCAAHLSCFDPLATASIAFVTDGMQVSVALATLGGAQGPHDVPAPLVRPGGATDLGHLRHAALFVGALVLPLD